MIPAAAQGGAVARLCQLGQPVVVFDGECVLCSRFFRFVLRQDRAQRFRFATAQSPLGQGLYTDLGLPSDDFQTNLVFARGRLFTKADAFAAAMRELGWPWRLAAVILRAPDWMKTPLYRRIARNRYRFFGRYDACLVPDAELRARFLEGGF